ncbi:MAG: hypothetical protein Q9160_003109 [Pyrenula sp. 1 TL-2023]
MRFFFFRHDSPATAANARATLAIFLLLSQFAAAVDLVLQRDPQAATVIQSGTRRLGWNIYLGTAEWDRDPGFLTDDGAFIALAQAAYKKMKEQAARDNVRDPPRTVTTLYSAVEKKAYFASSVKKTSRPRGSPGQPAPADPPYLPGDLIKLFVRPLWSQSTLEDPGPARERSLVLSTLQQCLEEEQRQNPGADEHEGFCAEPLALEQYFNRMQPPSGNERNGLANSNARLVAWSLVGGQEGVNPPCAGQRPSSPNAIGCMHLVNFLNLDFVQAGTPADSFPEPDRASAATICLNKNDP